MATPELSSVDVYQLHEKIYVEQFSENASFRRSYEGINELRIVVINSNKDVIGDTSYYFRCILGGSHPKFEAKYHKFFSIKTIDIDGEHAKVLTILLEMI